MSQQNHKTDEIHLRTIKTPAHVEWGNANGIPSSNETFVTGVKEDKGEHPIQHVHKFFSIFFILKRTSDEIKETIEKKEDNLIQKVNEKQRKK